VLALSMAETAGLVANPQPSKIINKTFLFIPQIYYNRNQNWGGKVMKLRGKVTGCLAYFISRMAFPGSKIPGYG